MGGVDYIDNSVACYRYGNLNFQIKNYIYREVFGLQGGLPHQEMVVPDLQVESKHQCRQLLEASHEGNVELLVLTLFLILILFQFFKVTGRKEPFLNFLRELVLEMMAQHGTPPNG